MSAGGVRSNAAAFLAARGGATAVEFALLLPFLLLLYLGGYELTQALSTYRKLTDTTAEIGRIVSEYSNLSSSSLNAIFNASSEIMTPYSTAKLKIVVSEISTDANSHATVTWSQPYNGGVALKQGASVNLPSGLAMPSSSYVLVQTSYSYSPTIGAVYVPQLALSDSIYMLPRQSTSIAYTG